MSFQVIFVWRVLRVKAASRRRVTQSPLPRVWRVQAASRRRVIQSPLQRDKPVTSVSQMSRPKDGFFSGERNGDVFASLCKRNLWSHLKFFCSCFNYWKKWHVEGLLDQTRELKVLVSAKNHAVWKPPKKSATSEMRALLVFSQTWMTKTMLKNFFLSCILQYFFKTRF